MSLRKGDGNSYKTLCSKEVKKGEAKLIDAPAMFEDSGIFKYNGKYYYSYCSNFTSQR